MSEVSVISCIFALLTLLKKINFVCKNKTYSRLKLREVILNYF